MSVKRPAVLYLHGFNSSPDSLKAQQFKEFCQSAQLLDPIIPTLSYDPEKAIAQLHQLIKIHQPVLILGSSLGGFYATVLAEQYGLKAVLINPAVAPFKNLEDKFIGVQKNFHTGEEYEFTRAHAVALLSVAVEKITCRENYLVLIQTGDEVLDYREAEAFYRGTQLKITPGGNHSFEHFENTFPLICEFAGLR